MSCGSIFVGIGTYLYKIYIFLVLFFFDYITLLSYHFFCSFYFRCSFGVCWYSTVKGFTVFYLMMARSKVWTFFSFFFYNANTHTQWHTTFLYYMVCFGCAFIIGWNINKLFNTLMLLRIRNHIQFVCVCGFSYTYSFSFLDFMSNFYFKLFFKKKIKRMFVENK